MRRAPLPELVAYLYDSTLNTKLTVTSRRTTDSETVMERVSREGRNKIADKVTATRNTFIFSN